MSDNNTPQQDTRPASETGQVTPRNDPAVGQEHQAGVHQDTTTGDSDAKPTGQDARQGPGPDTGHVD